MPCIAGKTKAWFIISTTARPPRHTQLGQRRVQPPAAIEQLPIGELLSLDLEQVTLAQPLGRRLGQFRQIFDRRLIFDRHLHHAPWIDPAPQIVETSPKNIIAAAARDAAQKKSKKRGRRDPHARSTWNARGGWPAA